MMIAQLTFRGMPLAQGMLLARMIRLHEIQDNEIRWLCKAVMELPIPALSEKHITLGSRTFQSTGEAVGHLIIFGLSEKLGIEEIGLLTLIAGWILIDKVAAILGDAIQRAHAQCELRAWLKVRLDEAACTLPDKIWAYRDTESVSTQQIDRRARTQVFRGHVNYRSVL